MALNQGMHATAAKYATIGEPLKLSVEDEEQVLARSMYYDLRLALYEERTLTGRREKPFCARRA